MARRKRSDVFLPSEVAIVHVMNRTNHGIYLFGRDPDSGRSCDHRKDWMEQRLQLHAACFAIDLLGFSILSNHFHQVLRSRPDIVATWSDQEVARRWLTLCPEDFDERGIPLDPSPEQIDRLCRKKDRIKEIRVRLSDISWWMRLFNQMIAQWVNREEGIVGHLWQGRFKAVRIMDEVALLACMVYVDLNPIRAALVETLEESRYTSAYHRILSVEELRNRSAELEHLATTPTPADTDSGKETHSETSQTAEPPTARSSFEPPQRVIHGYKAEMNQSLAPVELAPAESSLDEPRRSSRLRCSDKGFLDLTNAEYITLLDWTARQLRVGSVGSTPPSLAPLFERLGISTEIWLKLVRKFRKSFGDFAGVPTNVSSNTAPHNQKRYRIPKETRELLVPLT